MDNFVFFKPSYESMKKILFIVAFLAAFSFQPVKAQQAFGDACLGVWKGTMHLYSRGVLKDSVNVELTVAKTADPKAWTWRTAYLSTKLPMVKDYILRLHDAEKGVYIVDEGEGVLLYDYLFGSKLYDLFEIEGVTLTSTYELRGNELVFEVTSGKKHASTDASVTNYSVDHLQRVVFKKQ